MVKRIHNVQNVEEDGVGEEPHKESHHELENSLVIFGSLDRDCADGEDAADTVLARLRDN